MKVKELIEHLKKLDQERNIWIFYDFPYACSEPDFSEVGEWQADCFKEEGCAQGDYAHWAG